MLRLQRSGLAQASRRMQPQTPLCQDVRAGLFDLGLSFVPTCRSDKDDVRSQAIKGATMVGSCKL